MLTIGHQRDVEFRKLDHSGGTGLDDKGQWADLNPALFHLTLERLTEGFGIGHIGLIELGHMRNHQSITHHINGGKLLNSAHFLDFDSAKARKVLIGYGR